MNYLTQIENESDDALDILTKKYKIPFLSIQLISSADRRAFKIYKT